MSDSILSQRQGAVVRLTLNRPDVLNAFNLEMARALQGALADASADPSVRAILLTGSGRAFCAGQDLASIPVEQLGTLDLGQVIHDQYAPIITTLREIEKPVVCAVNGVAAGAGASLAFACDVVVASSQASFIQSFTRIGLVPDSGGTWTLPRLAGMARASALMLLGDKLGAVQARDWGLIWEVVDGADLLATASAVAERLASLPTRALGLTKRLLNASLASDLATQLALEEELQRAAGRTADFGEGVRAFLEKRPPAFEGR